MYYVNLVDDIKATTICLLRYYTQENFMLPGVPRAFISRDFSAGKDPISCSHASANSEQIFSSDNGRGFFFYAKVNCLFLSFPACFLIPITFSNFNFNRSNLLDMRNLQEKVKNAF